MIRHAALALSLMVGMTSPHAEDDDRRSYDINIILFEDVTGRYREAENWQSIIEESDGDVIEQASVAPDRNAVDSSDLIMLGENIQPLPFTNDQEFAYGELKAEPQSEAEYPPENSVIDIYPVESSTLDEEFEKLRSNRTYRILYRATWRHVGLDKESMIPLEIDSRTFVNRDKEVVSLDGLLPEDDTNEKDASYIEGVIRVELARYLHVYTDITYHRHEQVPTPISLDLAGTGYHERYRFDMHRRMRSNRLHYVDHPLIGMLVLATPVIEENKEDEEPAG